MTRTESILSVGIITLGLILATNASAKSYNDDYIGGIYQEYPPGSGTYVHAYSTDDIIGRPTIYNISTVDATVGTSTDVKINTNYVNNIGHNGTVLGDLWFSTNGYNPVYADSGWDYYIEGEVWEYALVVDDHDNDGVDDFDGTTNVGDALLYAVDMANYILSEDPIFGLTVFRAGQEVQYDIAGQQALATGSWSLGTDSISFSIDTLSLGVTPADELAIRWTMTCANDIVEIELDPVPEPATMLLFGAGIAGLAGLRSRKKQV